eukprot:COSAG02_NODE_919_length_15936_cov_5.055314_12_plen_42_part_00
MRKCNGSRYTMMMATIPSLVVMTLTVAMAISNQVTSAMLVR